MWSWRIKHWAKNACSTGRTALRYMILRNKLYWGLRIFQAHFTRYRTFSLIWDTRHPKTKLQKHRCQLKHPLHVHQSFTTWKLYPTVTWTPVCQRCLVKLNSIKQRISVIVTTLHKSQWRGMSQDSCYHIPVPTNILNCLWGILSF